MGRRLIELELRDGLGNREIECWGLVEVEVVEYNLELVKVADWVVDMGPGTGLRGAATWSGSPRCHLRPCRRKRS